LFVSLLWVFNMASCPHGTLELLPERKTTLRCRFCHLTLSGEELGEGFCPECFETSGSKRYEFEELVAAETNVARYRCEECGAIISA
jgi:Fe-S-cluster-containing dehydrogenase component